MPGAPPVLPRCSPGAPPGAPPGASSVPRDGHHRGDLREAQRIHGARIRDQEELQGSHEERPGQKS